MSDKDALEEKLAGLQAQLRDAPARTGEKLDEVKAATAKLKGEMEAKVVAVLTPEQKAKAQELRTQMEQRRQQRAEKWQGRGGRF